MRPHFPQCRSVYTYIWYIHYRPISSGVEILRSGDRKDNIDAPYHFFLSLGCCLTTWIYYKQKQPPEVFFKISQNSQENTCALCQSLFFNNVAGLMPANLLKKILWHRCFPVNFAKFWRTPFFMEHLRWLLLYKQSLFSYFVRYASGFTIFLKFLQVSDLGKISSILST